MSMIQCPSCHKEISDKAEKCVHCGYNLKNNVEMLCPECGEIILTGMTVCPKCGYPVKRWYEPEQRTKKKIKPGTILAILLIAAFALYLIYAQAKNNRANAYYDTIDSVYESMEVSVDAMDECYVLLMNVWNNAIWSVQDPATDKYVRPNGVFVDDFNDALESLYSDPRFMKKLEIIEEQQNELRKLKRDLENPPAEMAEYNDLMVDLIDHYVAIAMLTINPSGTYMEMQDKFNILLNEGNEISMELAAYND